MTPQTPTVYVVDDDASVHKALERLLRSVGYNALVFGSAEEYLDHDAQPSVPGCLVLDIQMPALTGLELQSRLANQAGSLPIIFITGHGSFLTASKP